MLGRIVLAILGGIAWGFAVAASGVLMTLFGFIESIFGFTPEQISNVMEFFLALDAYGSAENVADDDTIARVQRDIYAESKGFSRRERKGRKAHAAQSTCLRSLTR